MTLVDCAVDDITNRMLLPIRNDQFSVDVDSRLVLFCSLTALYPLNCPVTSVLPNAFIPDYVTRHSRWIERKGKDTNNPAVRREGRILHLSSSC